MTLRARLFVLVAAIVAVTVALVTWTVSASARRAFEAVDAQRTVALMAQFRRDFAREREDVGRRVERLAASDQVRRVADDVVTHVADASGHVGAAASLAAAYDLDVVDLVSSNKTIISSAHWPARFGYQHPWLAGVPSNADAGAFLQPVESATDTALAIVAIRTVPAAGGSVSVVGGRWLDRDFLKSLSLPDGIRLAVYRDAPPENPDLEPLIARVRESGREAEDVIRSAGDRETVRGIPLKGRDGAIVGVLLVASSSRDLDALLQRIQWSGLVFGLLGILIGGGLSYAVASRVTRPVEQLASRARSIAAGDWDAPVDVHATGEVGQLASAFSDMTRQLTDQRERLVQAERVAAWRELARRLAHELKNPLFPLSVTIDNLQRAKAQHPREFDEVFEESVATLRTGVQNLTGVIARFGDFARMPPPVFEHASLNDIVTGAAKLFRAQLERDNAPITLSLDLDPGVGTIEVDREQIGRALQNLILNAIDAMPKGGSISIQTIRTANAAHVRITDTGEGLMDEERERLFTPYYTTKQHGTGLGLAIVQSVIADHHGRIRIESVRGRGTTFDIELPLAQGSSS